MTQTVALARVLALYPAADGNTIAKAFGSRDACVIISPTAPLKGASPSSSERDLAEMLAAILGDLATRGEPRVAIEPLNDDPHACPRDGVSSRSKGHDAASLFRGAMMRSRVRVGATVMSVPLADGRWVTRRRAVELPGGWNRAAVLSFLLSSLATAAVAFAVIRR